MSTLLHSYTVTNAIVEEMAALGEQPSKQAYDKPAAENAATAKALINSLMQDKFFLALFRSNDPSVRAAALDKLNEAHYQAYGDAPVGWPGGSFTPPRF
ncbi:MAG TPA: hypothetical protein VNR65_11355 [Geobacterales bacterium]|jgi:hypothetical protein|nr:hypothetical protein [Geobacterales bacterium]